MPTKLPYILIPSYHRADNLKTVQTLIRAYNYDASRIVVIIDDQGGDYDAYKAACDHYGCHLEMFNLDAARAQFDFVHRPSPARRAAGCSRNMFWKIAKEKYGITNYIVIDDDMRSFQVRPYGVSVGPLIKARPSQVQLVLSMVQQFCIDHHVGLFGLSQTGEMIASMKRPETRLIRRKVMNVTFYNSDYVRGGERGVQDNDTSQFATAMYRGLWCASLATGLVLEQTPSATSPGGLTELYKECKLLNKALVTVIQYPSAVHAEYQPKNGGRLHHRIRYRYLSPCLLKVRHGNNIGWDVYPEDVPFTCVPNRRWRYVDSENDSSKDNV